MRGRPAGNQSDIVLYQTSRERCVDGRGVVRTAAERHAPGFQTFLDVGR